MGSANQTIIRNTKLQKPYLPDDFIPRTKLLAYLNENINRPLTLVSAGAGYGKSSFIRSWLDSVNIKNCWFSIDKQDNDIRTFLNYLIVAIQSIEPGFGNSIYKSIFSPNIASIDILTNNLINDLNGLNDDIIIVFDDFQNIINTDIISLISNILKHPPGKFHLTIISRTDPPLPLHKLRAENKMKDICSKHLQFNNSEIKLFLQKNISVDEDIVLKLHEESEGWITGIRIFKIHLSFSDFDKNKIENIIKRNNLTEEYFVEELTKHIDDNTLLFLLITSLLQKFNSDLSDFVLLEAQGNFDSTTIIGELLKKNLFLINLDDVNQWFRYHHLFQKTLQHELNKKYQKQDIINIHKKASEWYIKNDLFEEAFYHITQIGNTDEITLFIRKNMHMPLNANKWFVLEKWLNYLPDNVINQCPILLTAQMWIMQHKGAYWIIPELINRVEEIKNNNIELYNSIKYQLVFFKATINFWNGNITDSIEQFSYVRNNLSADKLGTLSLSSIYFATASQLSGNTTNVYNEIQSEISRTNLPADYKIILLGALIYIKLLEGDLYSAERITKRFKETVLLLNNNFYIVWYNFFMGYITFMQYNISDALYYFNNALKQVYLLNTHAPVDTFAGILLILKQTKQDKNFRRIDKELISFISEWDNPTYNTVAYSLKSRLSIIENNFEKAWEEFKKTDLHFNTKTIIFNIEVPEITYCRLLLAGNYIEKTNEAINKLTEIYNNIIKTYNIPQVIDVLILLSVAYYKKNNLPKAIYNISKAVSMAEKGHFIYPFVEQSEIVKLLLPQIKIADRNISEFISQLIEIISSRKDIVSVKELSDRELDIINLLAERLSNQEIADKLFISPLTVKRHTINIYKKMGVNKRRNAVKKAMEQGLIKSFNFTE